MTTSINQVLNGWSSKRDERRLRQLLNSMFTDTSALQTTLLNTGGLAIKAGASALAKTVNTIYYRINGLLYSKAAADMAALSGTVLTTKFNVYVFYVDAAGALTSAMGTAGATLAAVVFPTVPASKAVIGFVIINPTGTGSFVGGTTALDDGTVVPNAVYVNTLLPVFTPSTVA